ncbi:MAG: SurA N-terminal domain-containing protein [Zoogloeaceae bacterium]|jgi:peptidyl-prolyl cis-trans isomerase D|nr:SurA N-terminal domain-containing protein [Zoogloeaceae bacterium]
MFDAVRNNRRFVQGFLALITIPFAIWGLESYQSGGGTAHVARVGDTVITQAEFQETLREQREIRRAELPPGADPALLDSPELREVVLNGLINERLIFQDTRAKRLQVANPVLTSVIASLRVFQENGKFSEARYKSVLAARNMTPELFERQTHQQIQRQYLIGSLTETGFSPRSVTQRIAALQLEEREVQAYPLSWKPFADAAKPEAEAIRKFYDEESARFVQPEEATVEYILLRDVPEERRASHILFLTEGVKEDEKAKIRAEAERVLALVRKDPATFASLARQHSQDPGSAQAGGDLGFFPRKAMVKPFEDAVFAMQEGEISDIVATEFGFHVIQLTGIKAARYGSDFARVIDDFSNRLFENPESLKPAAEQFGLEILKSGPLTREGGKGGLLDHPKVLAAIFNEEVRKGNVNSEAVVIGEGEVLAARVLEYKPSARLPFERVKDEIARELQQKAALARAAEQGAATLAELVAGKEVSVRWNPAETLSRVAPGKLDAAAIRAVFSVDAATLPRYVGVTVPEEGYVLYRINKVTPREANEAELKGLGMQLAFIQGRTQLQAYLAALRQKNKVEINHKGME